MHCGSRFRGAPIKSHGAAHLQTNVGYDYTSGTFKSLPKKSALAVHFFMEGRLLPADSDEARDQAKFVDLIANRELLLASSSTSTTDDKNDAEEVASDDYPEVALSVMTRNSPAQ